MNVNELIHGFKLNRIEEIEEQKATAFLFDHLKSGARLIWIKNDNIDKAFSIAFKTLPDDDTGVMHIIEHSVLCGSEKYTVKEPFLDLLKNSMATFLNAMTFADKTMYPVSSANDKDFMNLMGVYLDAVFFPRFHNMEEIFLQEGWHYEEGKEGNPSAFTGVVLNEMRGVFGSVDSAFWETFDAHFYPDTIYAKCSGGHPKAIPTLTYEKFKATHKKYYHPDNSYIVLYGDMDVEPKLEFIDKEYLSKFEKTNNKIEIEAQKPLGDRFVEKSFEVKPGESTDNKSVIGRGYYVCDFDNVKVKTAFDILMDTLVKSNEAPLKKAILEAKIADDFSGHFDDSGMQNRVIFRLKNTNPDKAEEFVSLLEGTLKKIAEEGLDHASLESTFNMLEFQILENDKGYSAGVTTAIDLMSYWLYGGDPVDALKLKDVLNELHSELEKGYFENLIKEYILGSNHKMTLVLKPDEHEQEARLAFEKEQMDAYESNLGDEGKAAWVEKIEKLKTFQSHEDTPEEKATLPRVHLNEIDKVAPTYKVEILKDKNRNDFRFYDYATNGISYFRAYFDVTNLTDEQIQYLSILRYILYSSSTNKYSLYDLINLKDSKLGGFIPFVTSSLEVNNDYHVLFCINAKYLDRNYSYLKEICEEGLYNTKFDEKEIKNILVQRKAAIESDLDRNGTSYASKKAVSHLSQDGYFTELFSGYSFYLFLKDIVDNFEEKKEQVISSLKELTSIIQNSFYMQSLVGPKESLDKLLNEPIHFGKQKDRLDVFKAVEHKKTSFAHKNSGMVNYNVSAFNFLDEGFEYKNSSSVLKKIVSLDYLWNNVRVKGGAYGTSISISKNGVVTLTSYRDPNLKKTYETYQNVIEYIKNFNPTDQDMEGYLIGVFSSLTSPVKNRDIGAKEDFSTIAKMDNAYIQQIWDDVAATTKEEIISFAEVFEKCMCNASNCTFGSAKTIEENQELFAEID